MSRRRLLALLLLLPGCAAAPEGADGHAAGAQEEARTDPDLERAFALLRGNDPARAARAFEDWLDAHPGSRGERALEAHRWAAHAHALAGKPDASLTHCDAAIALAPGAAWPRYARGTALMTMGRYGEAVVAYTDCLARDPGHVKALQFRAHVHRLERRPDAAVEDLDRALAALDATDEATLASWGGDRRTLRVWSLRERAEALEALGRHADARRDREAAWKLETGR